MSAMSSTGGQAEEDDAVCASCGKAAVDDVKLKICTACKLVKYCSVECQKIHRPQHKKACKKRAAEIRDDDLFTQPDGSHLGECPICCLPLSLDGTKSVINSCCCKAICKGCDYANQKREKEQGLEYTCPYCREELPDTQEEADQNYTERAKANDPVALRLVGKILCDEGNYEGAFESYTKAAELGDMSAHYNLAISYQLGEGVKKDKKKEVYHLAKAAIGGHPLARHNLGCEENDNGRIERAAKHWIIAARLGYDNALEAVRHSFAQGFVNKEDFEEALRGHQAAVDATKSTQREEAHTIPTRATNTNQEE